MVGRTEGQTSERTDKPYFTEPLRSSLGVQKKHTDDYFFSKLVDSLPAALQKINSFIQSHNTRYNLVDCSFARSLPEIFCISLAM